MRSPTFHERIKYFRWGDQLVGFDQLNGWSGELPFYKFNCDTHGKVIDYEHGHKKRLSCPICLEQIKINPKTL